MAQQGEMSAVRVMAKDLVRTRRYVKKFIMMKANIQAISLKITTLKSQGAMANAMKGVTKAMGSMNKQMNMPQLQKIMMDFEKEVITMGTCRVVQGVIFYIEITKGITYGSCNCQECVIDKTVYCIMYIYILCAKCYMYIVYAYTLKCTFNGIK